MPDSFSARGNFCKGKMSATEGDIVGIEQATNGRSCEMHGVCGLSLQVGEKVVFQMRHVVINGRKDKGITAFRVDDNKALGCLVGYLPASYLRTAYEYIGREGVISEFYRHSSNSLRREKSYRNHGIARFKLIAVESGDDSDMSRDSF
jgi:hypothetical protein